MSGHSKWSTIKRKKAATDAKRGKAFTKYLREIQVAAKLGGSNPEGNPRLKSAILAARSISVPNDNIERAVKRGCGDDEGVSYEEILYEGYGPGGVAVMVKALSDNRNRTAGDVRAAFSRAGGSLAGVNAVAFMFQECGVVNVEVGPEGEDAIFEVAIEAGAEDFKESGASVEITTSVDRYSTVRDALEEKGFSCEGEIRWIPSNTVRVGGDEASSLLKLLNMLDELDDVQSVVANFEMDDAEFEKLAG